MSTVAFRLRFPTVAHRPRGRQDALPYDRIRLPLTTLALAPAATPTPRRIPLVDVLRGVAIVAMVVYHFSWDLWAFGLTSADVEHDVAWVLFARSIASTFLILVGVSLVLATRNGLRLQQYLKRLGYVAGGALLVTIGTWIIEPQEFVYFGILHLIAVASVLALPFLSLPAWVSGVVGAAVVLLGNFIAVPFFNPPWLVWIGMATMVPATVDYVPLFPWFGAVLLGVAAGKVLVASGWDRIAAGWSLDDGGSRFLATAGRWSLVIYLLHQVVLYEGVMLVASALHPAPPPAPAVVTDPAGIFMNDCLASCGAQGQGVAVCTPYCACMYAGMAGTDLISTPAEQLTQDQRDRLNGVAKQCATSIPPPQSN